MIELVSTSEGFEYKIIMCLYISDRRRMIYSDDRRRMRRSGTKIFLSIAIDLWGQHHRFTDRVLVILKILQFAEAFVVNRTSNTVGLKRAAEYINKKKINTHIKYTYSYRYNPLSKESIIRRIGPQWNPVEIIFNTFSKAPGIG